MGLCFRWKSLAEYSVIPYFSPPSIHRCLESKVHILTPLTAASNLKGFHVFFLKGHIADDLFTVESFVVFFDVLD